MSTPFHQTQSGRRFFDGQLPQLIKAIEGLAERLPSPSSRSGGLTLRGGLRPGSDGHPSAPTAPLDAATRASLEELAELRRARHREGIALCDAAPVELTHVTIWATLADHYREKCLRKIRECTPMLDGVGHLLHAAKELASPEGIALLKRLGEPKPWHVATENFVDVLIAARGAGVISEEEHREIALHLRNITKRLERSQGGGELTEVVKRAIDVIAKADVESEAP